MSFRSGSLLLAGILCVMLGPVAIGQSSDMTILKTGPAQAAADTDVSYSVSITNLGPDASFPVTVSDAIPTGMTFVSETHDAAFSCSTPAVGFGGTVSCTSASLAAGASASFTFVFHVDAGAAPGTTFSNIAIVSVNPQDSDPNEENNSSLALTEIPPPPSSDLGVTKVGPDSAGPDTDVTYTITFFNGGPGDATTGTLSDTLPGTMTFVSLSQTGTLLNCVTPSVGAGGSITCTAAPLAAGASTTITLVGHIPALTASGTSFTNTVTVSGGNDFNEENNQSTTGLAVSDVDVSVNKTGPATVTAGSPVTYTITVANAGPDVASAVLLTDVIPTGTTFVSLTQDTGPPASCTTPLPGTAGQVSCSWPSMASAANAQFTLVVNSGTAVTITNTAGVSTDSYDSNTSNNSSTVNTTVTQSADLTVTKSGPGTVTAGTNVTYNIGLSNGGPSIATNVVLNDPLPANTTFVSLTQTSGPTFSCTTGATVNCTLASFPPAASATFDLVVAVSPAAPGGSTISNTVTASTSTPDPTANSATTNATVATSADVSVTKTGPTAVAPGADITYTVTVANGGPSDAAAVQLTDTLPAGTTFVSGSQNSGPIFSCTYPPSGAGGTITCTISSLASGATAVFSFVFSVPPTATGTITNTASVTSTTPDPAAGNGSATTSPAAVSPDATDLSITKTANDDQFSAGSPATYTLIATNNGPAVATNVVVTDVLPPGTTLVSATPTQGSCSGTTTVTCNAGVLLSGGSVTITLVVTLPTTYGPVSNTATVTSANADTNPANNSATAALDVTSEVPSLSPLALALLAMAMAGISVLVMKR